VDEVDTSTFDIGGEMMETMYMIRLETSGSLDHIPVNVKFILLPAVLM
jgi:hypothetical protein